MFITIFFKIRKTQVLLFRRKRFHCAQRLFRLFRLHGLYSLLLGCKDNIFNQRAIKPAHFASLGCRYGILFIVKQSLKFIRKHLLIVFGGGEGVAHLLSKKV